MPFSFAICSSSNNPFFAQVIQGVFREIGKTEDARLLSWKGEHLIPPAALVYLSPDALILGAMSQEEAARPPSGIPALCFSNAHDHNAWPRLTNDDRQVGELTARALMDAGYQQLRILGETRKHHHRLRCEGAMESARSAGIPCEVIDTTLPPPGPGQAFAEIWESHRNRLFSLLKDCPENTGLLVLDGNLASELLHLLREEVKRPIPEEIGLIVADLVSPENEDQAHVLLPGEEIGRCCVQSLLRHLRDPSIPLPEEQTVSPRDIYPGHTLREEEIQILYQRLDTWCRKHLREQVTVEHAAADLGLSRRSLEMKLHTKGLPSPYELLTEIRLQEACHLLTDTSVRIGDIAEATGFQTARALTNRFRAHHGLSPREWRKKRGVRSAE